MNGSMDKSMAQDVLREGSTAKASDPKVVKTASQSGEEAQAAVQEGAPKEAAERRDEQRAERPAGARHQRLVKNSVRKMRMERMMSKAELARRAGMSTLTIDRVERGLPCRMDTKRKILEALGLKPVDRVAVFGDEED